MNTTIICNRCKDYEKYITELHQTIANFRNYNDHLLHKLSDTQEQLIFVEQKIIEKYAKEIFCWFCQYYILKYPQSHHSDIEVFQENLNQFIQEILKNERHIPNFSYFHRKRKKDEIIEEDNSEEINKKRKHGHILFSIKEQNNNRKRRREECSNYICGMEFYKKAKLMETNNFVQEAIDI